MTTRSKLPLIKSLAAAIALTCAIGTSQAVTFRVADPAVAAITRKDPEPGPAAKPEERKGNSKPAPKK